MQTRKHNVWTLNAKVAHLWVLRINAFSRHLLPLRNYVTETDNTWKYTLLFAMHQTHLTLAFLNIVFESSNLIGRAIWMSSFNNCCLHAETGSLRQHGQERRWKCLPSSYWEILTWLTIFQGWRNTYTTLMASRETCLPWKKWSLWKEPLTSSIKKGQTRSPNTFTTTSPSSESW